ncbi:four helix bundle protein [Thiorhodococcus minor]|uniref:Four helix bundle protein n=1 Tax=Thiorhodococcus minor TaxID=57489 RepID=A0A6M0JXV4_9GAMM|nr:four helix bundle protein [Thiorhodococcus minor]
MGGMNYRDLIAWQKSMDLVDEIYRLTRQFPPEEKFGLSNQLRRAAVSIPSNIAEGQGRQSQAELIRFLQIAHGSLREVETQIMIACRQAYIMPAEEKRTLEMSAEAGRLIQGLINKLKQR